jgi:PQQ-like domain
MTMVLVILLATLVAHAVADSARRAGATVAAPALPAPPVVAVAHPEAGALLVTYDSATGHLVTLASAHEPFCPPVGPCQTARPDALVVLDGASSKLLARTALDRDTASAADASLLLDDPTQGRVYAVSPGAIAIFSAASGALVGHYALSPATPWSGGALDLATGRLYLVGGGHLRALDPATGAALASVSLPVATGAPVPDGPVLDTARGLLYVETRPVQASAVPQLLVYDAATLRQVGTGTLSLGARLGPLDTVSGLLATFGGDGHAWQVSINAAGAPSLTRVPALDGALALGANPLLRHRYVADATQMRLLDATTGRTVAALPLAARWPSSLPLPVDGARGLFYLPTDHGAIVIVKDGAGISAEPVTTAATAVILARAALAKLLPDTNQDPPFVAPETFPVGAGMPNSPETRPAAYWIHFADRGWQGSYPGTASVAIAPESGQGNAYRVTFTITWKQLFQRSHIWVCRVAPNGAVALLSESGDAVP